MVSGHNSSFSRSKALKESKWSSNESMLLPSLTLWLCLAWLKIRHWRTISVKSRFFAKELCLAVRRHQFFWRMFAGGLKDIGCLGTSDYRTSFMIQHGINVVNVSRKCKVHLIMDHVRWITWYYFDFDCGRRGGASSRSDVAEYAFWILFLSISSLECTWSQLPSRWGWTQNA